VHLSITIGLLIGAVLVAVVAYFLPERGTAITRDVVAEEIRQTVETAGAVAPRMQELKDLKDLKK